ncbi:hypothetical protein [Arthrobacter sp. NPDC057013]|uniref:hypothetical protein n=1 Tax=Arthrobacter sp. NPDC057013 TaxID=3345999 RepID=UPI00363335AC
METEIFWTSRIRSTEAYEELPLKAERRLEAAEVNKRRHIAPAILAEAGLGEINDVLLTHQVMPDTNRIVNAKAMEFEEDFRARKHELASELSNVPYFYTQNTKAGKKLVAIDFLTEKADGYRFLNSNFAVELSDAASPPRNIRRLQP